MLSQFVFASDGLILLFLHGSLIVRSAHEPRRFVRDRSKRCKGRASQSQSPSSGQKRPEKCKFQQIPVLVAPSGDPYDFFCLPF
jgi:hypothetical protein